MFNSEGKAVWQRGERIDKENTVFGSRAGGRPDPLSSTRGSMIQVAFGRDLVLHCNIEPTTRKVFSARRFERWSKKKSSE
jgi:hypothetical protein